MKRNLISVIIRSKVALRAAHRCEYCQIHEEDMFLSFEIDHVIALKHGGSNEIDNLAYSCPHCNQHKGSDIATYDPATDTIIPLYNPRKQIWKEHFSTSDGLIEGVSITGISTIKLLKLNDIDLVILRKLLSDVKRYPTFS